MKNLTIAFIGIIALWGCKKSSSPSVTIYNLDPSFKSGFAFQPGSYWIYQDSISGETDSAYVSGYTDMDVQVGGCVLNKNIIEDEYIYYTIKVVPVSVQVPATDSERWYVNLRGPLLGFYSEKTGDSVAEEEWFNLGQYPFAAGQYRSQAVEGCVLRGYIDSGYISLLPAYTSATGSFSNVAVSSHVNEGPGVKAYNDIYYLVSGVGLARVELNHLSSAAHRVLILQRYKIVQ
jgi:hypothetical protein